MMHFSKLRIFFSTALAMTLAIPAFADIATHIVIDEVFYDGEVLGDLDEFVELYNPTGTAVDMSGWWFGDEETDGGGEFYGQFPSGTVLAGNGRMVIAKDAAGFQNAWGMAADLVMGFALSNSGDQLILSSGHYTDIVDVVAWESGSYSGVVSFGSVASGQSMARTPSGEDSENCPVDFTTGIPTPSGGGGVEPPAAGAMQVWFNRSIDSAVATQQVALGNSDFFAPALEVINGSQYSLDLCLYSLTDHTIGNAVEAAHARGVVIRVITEASNNGSAAINDLLSLGIPVIDDSYGSNSGSGLMHNKFLIADARSGAPAGLAIVMMGSWNFNFGGWNSDANNLMRIDSDALAAIYTDEFNEMWGGLSDLPNSTFSEFSSSKTDNNSESATVDSIAVGVYFSPSDNVMSRIIAALASADHQIHFCAFSFTRQDVSDAMRSRYNAGVSVEGIFDQNQVDGFSEYHDMTGSGENPWSPPAPVIMDNLGGLLHHKYILIDANHPDSDPIVITGSANFSSSAENSNDENLLVIHDANIANQFYQEFVARYGSVGPVVTPIHDIQFTTDPAGISPLLGQLVTIEGVVSATSTSGLWVMQENTGAWNGISVYGPSFSVSEGDLLRVTGTVSEFFELTEINNVSSVVNLGTSSLPAAELLSCQDAALEQWESLLVRVSNVSVTNPDLGNNIWEISDGLDSLEVDDQSYLYTPMAGEIFGSITGTMTINFDTVKLAPRSASDFVAPLQAVTDLSIQIIAGSFVSLTWSAVPSAVSYSVHRLSNPAEIPNAGNRIATIAGTSHVEILADAPSVRLYRVVASDQ